ncbi:DMT family transporter [Mucilaginibacter segetis]|uniref:DMT family transporter n=1 Tax=Mucilaginibacter segetis TaxID=2793071 RepID=A0A934PX69_9SPHI|nr:DMT family transporter [Mucilaginibacter segetis]MBK0380795.1 DMT family transporter [Mucilaginibacter segetis]
MQNTRNPAILSPKLVNGLIFMTICLIWGSSFILMKLGLYDDDKKPLLTASQVAAIRIITAGIVLIPVLVRHRAKIPFKLSGYMVFSGIFGSFLPAFLFCIAETKIDSALAGTLNSLTPIFAIIFGFLFFGNRIPLNQIAGIIIGFGGIVLLYFIQKHTGVGEVSYGGLVILATIFYGINIVVVKRYLNGVSPLVITAFSLIAVGLPSLLILWKTGFFALPLHNWVYIKACVAVCTLGMLGTALAWVLFYALVQRTSVLFTTTASYGIPFVAFGWGWYYGETITLGQIACLLVILAGVYLTRINLKGKNKMQPLVVGK